MSDGGDLRVRLHALAPARLDAVGRMLREALAGSGEGARAEARMLLGHVLGLDLTGLVTGGDRIVAAAEIERLADLAGRRIAGEPVQRLIGSAAFFGLDFALSPATLVPRPDTETLVDVALGALEGVAEPAFADVGTGSGAILVALLHERGDARGIGIDLSGEAAATARGNAVRHGVEGRALVVEGSWTGMLAAASLDALLSNPPYIETHEIARLDAEVRLHDPLRALDGGPDGLAPYRVLAVEAVRVVKPGGFVAVEIGSTQASAVVDLFAAAGLETIAVVRDLAGRDRVVTARRPDVRATKNGAAK